MATSEDGAAAAAKTGLFDGQRVWMPEDIPAFMGSESLAECITARGGITVSDIANATIAVIAPEKHKLSVDSTNGVRILGAKCVKESIEKGSLPECGAQAVLCRAMEGVVLACDADVVNEMGTYIREMVELMCGRFVGDQLPSDATVLCGKTALSQAFQVASQRSLPVVRPSWVVACFRAQSKLPLTPEHLLPPLAGCVVCVTGLSVLSRQHVQQMVVSLGGSFSPEFSKRCTHLVAVAPNGPKFRASQVWRIPAVTIDWVLDSVNMKACQPTAPYVVHDVPHDAPFSLSLQTAGGQPQQQQQQQQPQPLQPSSSSSAAAAYTLGSLYLPGGMAPSKHRRRTAEGPALPSLRRQAIALLPHPYKVHPSWSSGVVLGGGPASLGGDSGVGSGRITGRSAVDPAMRVGGLSGGGAAVASPGNGNGGTSSAHGRIVGGPIPRAASPGSPASRYGMEMGMGIPLISGTASQAAAAVLSQARSPGPLPTIEEAAAKLQAALTQLLDACDTAITCLGAHQPVPMQVTGGVAVAPAEQQQQQPQQKQPTQHQGAQSPPPSVGGAAPAPSMFSNTVDK